MIEIIKKLLYYAERHLQINLEDKIFLQNLIYDKLNNTLDQEVEFNKEEINKLEVPDILIDELKEKLISNNYQEIDVLITYIMGLISPLPSFVKQKVDNLGLEKGLEYLHSLQIKNNYIQKTALEKNIFFKHDFDSNYLEVTINLAKPEKNNQEIARGLVNKEEKYPSCLLCYENIGFVSHNNKPSRTNLRVIDIKLNNEDFFIQYSPYAYFSYHAIIINKKHQNMIIDENTFIKLFDFIDLLPSFFIGSNADLPIVGGSILNHEHYQGGKYILPIFNAIDKEIIYDREIKISILDWYNSTIKISGKNKKDILKRANIILNKWKEYQNEELDIISYTDKKHSTITPIVRKVNDIYQMFLVLRNNRCNEEYEDGIFHAHKEFHHIKKEGIGLIEASGLFVLPPRLKKQIDLVIKNLIGESNDDLFEFNQIIKRYGQNNSFLEADKIVKDYISNVCKEILKNTAVFKDNKKGIAAFKNFIQSCL